ncbi:uncharacterized protein [Arachis hypogaea]|uniref:uncharacterized protein n=1 Tax=Arachis hypogaea TaxID=3818 RepID=UPI003B212A61
MENETVHEDPAEYEAEDEESLIVYGEEDISEGIKECQISIIGRLVTNKNINVAWIQTAMYNIWKKPEGFRVTEVKPKTYQFFFKNEADRDRVLRIWDLLEHCKTLKLGRKIAACMEKVKECELFEVGRDQERFIKATVKMKIDTPFMKGTNVGSKKDGLTWVNFKFEKPPTMCYYCGRTGHEENTCGKAEKDKTEEKKNPRT